MLARCCRYVVGVVVVCTALGSVQAATWRVEKDGSGDFTVIQDAVDVSASGDTIMIGPGRFDEGQIHVTPGWTEFVRVLVTVPELTIIGSGDETIIGQDEMWDLSQGTHKGIVAYPGIGSNRLRIESVCIENVGHGFYSEEIELALVNCLFRHNWRSILILGGGVSESIVDCRFENLERDGTHLFASGSQNLVVRNCTFSAWDFQALSQVLLGMSGVTDFLIENCFFLEADGGATVSLGSSGAIRGCTFDGQSVVGTSFGPSSTLLVEDCVYRNQNYVTELRSSSSALTVRNTSIESVADCSYVVSSVGDLSVQNCDLAAGSRGAVWVNDCTTTPPMRLDFTNNYWGTTDPEEIADLIWDRNDSDSVCRIVDFEPFRTESTPVEKKSLSDIKSLFR